MLMRVCLLAGRRRSREGQPGVSGREECAGGYLLRPEALFREHLPGAAGRCQRLVVAPPNRSGVGLPEPEHIALQRGNQSRS